MEAALDHIPQNEPCPCCTAKTATPFLSVPDLWFGSALVFELARCQTCSHVWLKQPPSPEELARYYGEDYQHIIRTAAAHAPNRWASHVKAISQHKNAGAVLDIGCSSGGFLGALGNSRWQLHGIELSKTSAAQAAEATGASVFVGDVLEADFPNQSFDLVTCTDVLEHFYYPRQVLHQVSAWSKPGGILYLVVPNIASLEARIFRSSWFGLDLPRHLHHFSKASLQKLAHDAGLQTVRIHTPQSDFAEQSLRIVLHRIARKLGAKRARPDWNTNPALPWRVVRKALRLTLRAPFRIVASSLGRGASLQAVFQKPYRDTF